MAAEITAEKIVNKIQPFIECPVCAEQFNTPKVLKCFHILCRACITKIFEYHRSLKCPTCCEFTQISRPEEIETLEDASPIISKVRELLDDMKKSDLTLCNRCSRRKADRFCCNCNFICKVCEEAHYNFTKEIGDHEIVTLGELENNFAIVFLPHGQKKSGVTKTCQGLKLEDNNTAVDWFLKGKISTLKRSIVNVEIQRSKVQTQGETRLDEIQQAFGDLQQTLEKRKKEIILKAKTLLGEKLKILEKQKNSLGGQIAWLQVIRGVLCSPGSSNTIELLIPVLNKINLDPKTLGMAEQADMIFRNKYLPKTKNVIEKFGQVYCHPVNPERCEASGEGITVATRGQKITVVVKAFKRNGDDEQELYPWPIDSLRCELIPSDDGDKKVHGTVETESKSIYNVSYEPQVTGEHQLHILVEEHPILNSPFAVTVLPNLTEPCELIEGLYQPMDVAVMKEGEVIIAEDSGVTMYTCSNKERKSLQTDIIQSPTGIAIDGDENILVLDSAAHFIHKISKTGDRLDKFGQNMTWPEGITVHLNSKIYVADRGNGKIQIFEKDLKYSGERESDDLKKPYDVATDDEGRVYVADFGSDNIYVFEANDDVTVSKFKFGKKDGLVHPTRIAIDSRNNIIYVCEHEGGEGILTFSTEGQFLKRFHDCKCTNVYVDRNGTVYLCYTSENLIQICK